MNDRRHKTEIQAMLAAIYNHYRARVSARSHPGSPAFFVCSLGFASFPAVRFLKDSLMDAFPDFQESSTVIYMQSVQK